MILYWFLPAIVLLGVISSYTDIKEGKIKNKHIILALAYSFIVYIILIFLNLGTIRIQYFIELLIMLALTLITGFIIWHVGLWTAGDAKLFFAFATLIPLSVYKHGHIPYFDSTNILVNTFVPAFFFLFFLLMFKTNFKQKIFFFKEALRLKEIFRLAVFLFAFTWIIEIMFKTINLPMDYFITIFLLFLIMVLLEKIIFVSLFKVVIAISILRIIFDHSIYSLGFAKGFLLILILFILLRFLIIRMSFYFLTREVDINLLKKGMLPAESVYVEKEKYKKQDLMFFSLFAYLQEKTKKRNYLFPPTDPLSEENVKKLKKLEKKLGFEHLRVQQTVPFAPFLFFGVLLTLLAQGNVFIVIGMLF